VEWHPVLNFPGLTYIDSVEESKQLNDLKGLLGIISASAVAETGRSLRHLMKNIQDPRTISLIFGWETPEPPAAAGWMVPGR
jgi:metallo-beta-lactamase family protein